MSRCDFLQNQEWEYFPCHPGADPATFSCLFCSCRLNRCGGRYTEQEG